MNIKRIIPCLTIFKGRLIKTTKFNLNEHTYLGDVLNAVRIFNEKKVEELIIKDIGASINNTDPDFRLIEKISNISRMPICYGGGIKTVDQAEKILASGIEKISISTAAIEDVNILKELADKIGIQSVSLTLDIKKINNEFLIFKNNGKINSLKNLFEFIDKIKNDIGELVINNIDRDGTMIGPDNDLVKKIYDYINVPLVILGGIGSVEDVSNILMKYKHIGVACGSLFVFKGKNRAVLINYPKKEILDNINRI